MRTLFLKKREDRRIRAGHLWVFSNEVDVKRSPLTDFLPGEAACLRDAAGLPLGSVYVNPASLIAARIFSRKEENLDVEFLQQRLKDALDLRECLYQVPYYRLCHGEGDWLPGLVIDRYGDVLCVQLTTAGMESRKEILLEALQAIIKPSAVLFRNDVSVREMEQLPLYVTPALGSIPDEVEIQENGIHYVVPLAEGQKTGWFYDQRVNRLEAARYAKGRSVLDAFCYAGGFGVAAAQAGASGVCFLDASKTALAYAEKNLHQNAPACTVDCVQGDALETLVALRDSGRRFGVVCLDPPAFIKRKKDAEKGLAAYRKVNDLGLQLIEDEGILVSCSCSHHLETDALRRLIAIAAAKRGMRIQMLYQGFQGPDHPVHPSMPETAYLKVLMLRVKKDCR